MARAGAVGIACIALAAAGCDLIFPPGGGPNTTPDDAMRGDAETTTTDGTFADAPALPDAPIDGDVGNDTDGDGYNDAIDNCPDLYNPDQYDKDLDATGDKCDPCPHLHGFTGADLDSDFDFVGNGCDPRPGTQGDYYAFVGFYDASEINGWLTINGTWMSDSGVLRQTDPTAAPARIVSLGLLDDGVVTIGVRGTDAFPGIVDHYVSIVTGISGNTSYQCQAATPGGAAGEVRLLTTIDGDTTTNTTAWFGGTIVGADLTMYSVMRSVTGNLDCYVRTEPTSDPQAGLNTGVGAHDGEVGIETYNVAAEISYLFVAHEGP